MIRLPLVDLLLMVLLLLLLPFIVVRMIVDVHIALVLLRRLRLIQLLQEGASGRGIVVVVFMWPRVVLDHG